jgi:two-component system NtrC family sensor kinase
VRLALKLVSVVLVGIVALVAIDGYLSVRREVRLFEADMKHDAHLFGEMLRAVVRDAWRSSGEQRARELVADADRRTPPLHARWVWLDAAEGPDAPSVPKEVRAGSEDASFYWRGADGTERLFTYIPASVSPARPGAIEVSEDLSPRRRYTRTTIERVGILAVVLLLAGGTTALFLGVRLIGRPLHTLTEKTRRIGVGDLSQPLSLKGHDELSELADALNHMCDQLAKARERVREETAARVAALEQLRHADRLKTVGRLASGIAHELGTPLNIVSGRAGMIAAGRLAASEVKDSAQAIRAQAERMTAIIRNLLDFARQRPVQRVRTDLRELAKQTTNLVASLSKKRGATIAVVGADAPAPVSVDPGQIQQVLTNLVMNAIQAVAQGGHVEIGFAVKDARPPAGYEGRAGAYQCMYVRDDGAGIAEADLQYIFEPFFTTKDVGKGTGLGLSIAHGIVREHGGWIEVASKPGEGSCCTIYFPLED